MTEKYFTNLSESWIACGACGQRVTGDSIHTCSPQLKTLTNEEITQVFDECYPNNADGDVVTLIDFARAILRKAQEK